MTDLFEPAEQFAFFLEGRRNTPLSPLWILPLDGEGPGSIWRISLRHLKPAAFFHLRTQLLNLATPGQLSMTNPPLPTASSWPGGSPSYLWMA
jgi:hypothetical protein